MPQRLWHLQLPRGARGDEGARAFLEALADGMALAPVEAITSGSHVMPANALAITWLEIPAAGRLARYLLSARSFRGNARQFTSGHHFAA
jgi:hypothetical protein